MYQFWEGLFNSCYPYHDKVKQYFTIHVQIKTKGCINHFGKHCQCDRLQVQKYRIIENNRIINNSINKRNRINENNRIAKLSTYQFDFTGCQRTTVFFP